MNWLRLKAGLLSIGSARMEGASLEGFLARSTAGPGAGGPGSVFFSDGTHRVRLTVGGESPVTLVHRGGGEAVLRWGDRTFTGRLEPVALHCPGQAYVTLSERCTFRCRYCTVPLRQGRVKTAEELEQRIRQVRNRIRAISITSGMAVSVADEEKRTLDLIHRVRPLGIPIGVSIYPTPETPRRLHLLGVAEVKFNLETATAPLFSRMCPGLDRDLMWRVLEASVPLFGEGHVFSNLIVGLGETDDELETVMEALADRGVIPVLRPLLPAAELTEWERPPAERLLGLYQRESRILRRAGLDPGEAVSMCVACTGCDLVPGRDE